MESGETKLGLSVKISRNPIIGILNLVHKFCYFIRVFPYHTQWSNPDEDVEAPGASSVPGAVIQSCPQEAGRFWKDALRPVVLDCG